MLYGLLMLGIRLHLNQMAYQFDERKAYERTLKEHQRRLEAKLLERLSPGHESFQSFQEPKPEEVVRIP